MSAESNLHTAPIMDESIRIKDRVLTIESEVQALADARRAELLPAARPDLEYHEPEPVDMSDLVDVRISGKSLVITPGALAAVLPITPNSAETTRQSRIVNRRIMRQEDDRLGVTVGPCSIHDVDAALKYAKRVKSMREEYAEDLEITMRMYFEKPRTTMGWKGLIYDPLLDGSADINLGIVMARMLACQVTDDSVPLATERLNAQTPQFFNGLIAIDGAGARNAADQKMREYGSGTSSLLFVKNDTSGNVNVAAQAVVAANAPHAFIGENESGMICQVNTTGNDDAYIMLRGGDAHPNYSSEDVARAKATLRRNGLPEVLGIDVSHGNSRKQASKQMEVVLDVAEQITLGEIAIRHVMIESHLVAGSQELKGKDGKPQKLEQLRPGQSITDECIGIEQTEGMLPVLARAVQKRREVLQAA